MPKANEAKNTKVTAVADLKSVETQEESKAASPEETAEEKVDAVEKNTEAAKATRAPRKTAAKKNAGKKGEKTETVYIQCGGQEFEMSDIMEKVRAATKSLRSVHEISIYVKPEENRAYYVAKKNKGEEVGSVEI